MVSPPNVLWAGGQNFRSHLFVDDMILIEPALDNRLGQSSGVWGEGSYMAIGSDALNRDKLGVDGLWSSKQIILGYEVGSELPTLTLPEEEI